ncbi:MAG: hypothetical protein GFH24_608434n3 [Chloroflexi bacterium AL-N5]|nr:hypothetical protein [Chloroflexi bacterium AL-N5]
MTESAIVLGSVQKRLDLIDSALKEAGWATRTFDDARAALKRLQTQKHILFCCDTQLRGASVTGVIALVKKLSAETRFYLFSDDPDSEKYQQYDIQQLSFPPVLSHLPVPSNRKTLTELLKQTESSLTGNTSSVALFDVLDMLAMGQQSALVELEFGRKGMIHLNKGRLEHATSFGSGVAVQGLKALGQLITLENTEFRILPYKAPPRATINLPVSTAMTEASRLADEELRYHKIIQFIQKECPGVQAIAVGYPMSSSASQGIGDIQGLFTSIKALLAVTKDAVNAKPVNLFLSTEKLIYGVISVGEGSILAASARLSSQDALYRALRKAQMSLMQVG